MLTNLVLDLVTKIGVFLQRALSSIAPLTKTLFAIVEPGTALIHNTGFHAHIEHAAFLRNAFAIHEVEFCLTERWCDLVLDDLRTYTITDEFAIFLHGLDTADIDTHRRVELERAATRGGLWASEHDTDLLAQLIDENAGGIRFRKRTRELAQCLAHEAGLQADRSIAHFAFDLGAWHQSCDRVDDHAIDRAAANEQVADLECLLTGIRLRDEQLIDIDTEKNRVSLSIKALMEDNETLDAE